MQIEVIEIKPVDPPKEYILRIDQNELDLIAAVIGSIGDYDGPKGWREVGDNIYRALESHMTSKHRFGNLADKILKVKPIINSNPSVKPK